MKNRNRRLIGLIACALALLLAVGAATVFSACGRKEDGEWMRCHQPQLAVTWSAAGLGALLLAAAFARNGGLQRVLYALSVAACVVIFLFPGVLMPMCMMRTMRCYAVMQPFARLMTGLIAALSCVAFAQTVKRSR